MRAHRVILPLLTALLVAVAAARAQGPDAPEGAPRVGYGRGAPTPSALPTGPAHGAAGAPSAAPAPAPSSATPPSGSPTLSIAELLTKARAGDVEAQNKLGLAYLTAKPPNFVEAGKWFRQAADGGSPVGAHNVGELYEAGLGVPKSPAEAVKWFQLSAQRGYAPAQAKLGQHYEKGLGVPQDYADALKWYRAAADQKNAAGQNSLGTMYYAGRGVGADQTEATRLFRLAADQGLPAAQANLGYQYLAGRGTGQNDPAAYFWLNLAAARLSTAATGPNALRDQVARVRDTVAGKLAPAELERMQHLAAMWQPGSVEVPADRPIGPGGSQSASAPASATPGGAGAARGSGTGFVVNPAGFVLTNNHVVAQCNEVRARHGASPLGSLTVVAKDAQNDLALLKLAARFPDAATFREERGVRQGDAIVVYGFPLAGGLAASGNLTTGTISALAGLRNDSRQLQVSAPVQPGNSGGPLLDAGGNVLGVVQSQLNAVTIAAAIGSVPQNVNFAIKASVARNFLDANGVEYRSAPLTNELKPADIGDRAKKFTLFLECFR